jgi:hypothetical protein
MQTFTFSGIESSVVLHPSVFADGIYIAEFYHSTQNLVQHEKLIIKH